VRAACENGETISGLNRQKLSKVTIEKHNSPGSFFHKNTAIEHTLSIQVGKEENELRT